MSCPKVQLWSSLSNVLHTKCSIVIFTLVLFLPVLYLHSHTFNLHYKCLNNRNDESILIVLYNPIIQFISFVSIFVQKTEGSQILRIIKVDVNIDICSLMLIQPTYLHTCSLKYSSRFLTYYSRLINMKSNVMKFKYWIKFWSSEFENCDELFSLHFMPVWLTGRWFALSWIME